VEFGLLGPLLVRDGARRITVSAPRQRVLLAALLLEAGRAVSLDALADSLWDGEPPAGARGALHSAVQRLRVSLGPSGAAVISTRPAGYCLDLADGEFDVAQFTALAGHGHAAAEAGLWEQAAGLLGQALELWRGEPLADIPSRLLREREAARLDDQRLRALAARVNADLQLGRHDAVVPELRQFTAAYPLREGVHAQLMLALYRSGRQADALAVYQGVQRVLADELGIDPGPELKLLYQRILAADPQLMSPAAGQPPAAASGQASARRPQSGPGQPADANGRGGPAAADLVIPRQLPAGARHFAGRDEELKWLSALAAQAAGDGLGVLIAAIDGTAGVGKTALAVHFAHQVARQFPDGQLYVDLLGAAPQPLPSGDVLARFLRDLGVPGDKVPAGDDERAALYRTRLTGRRVLVVLDNARDTAQVRPLLPGSASCAVLVTTRNRTADLASTRFVDLNVLDDDEALALFSRILGEADSRPAQEPEATAEVLEACAGLPLAIRICAARLAARSHWRIATMAHRLRDERRRLDELKVGDLAVRASFQVSYDSLHKPQYGADPARAFRLLGLWQGPVISIHAAVALLGEPEPDVAEALESLVDANLLESSDPDWYRFHDLLRFYATERARAEEPEEECAAAVARLLGWYLHTADAAAAAVAPHRYRVPGEGSPGPPALPVSSLEEALGWYDSERENLVAAARQAAAAGLHDIAWRLPATLWPIFSRRRNIADCVTTTRIAVASARVAGHRQGEAWALQNLGQALAKIGDSEALPTLEQALAIRREIADDAGEAQTAVSLADAYHKIQGAEVAYERSLRCLEILRKFGNAPLLGIGLVNHGEYSVETGRLEEAAACLREAYDLWRDIGGYGEGWALHNLGHVHLLSGQLDEAITCLAGAYRVHQASGDLIGQATTLNYLRQAHQAVGDHAAAREARDTALAILEGLKHDADVVGLYASIVSAPA